MGLLDETLSALAGRKMPPGYERRFAMTVEGIYWHLFWGDQRINGGLSEDSDYAHIESCRAAWNHRYSVTEQQRVPENRWDIQEYMALLRHGSDREGWWMRNVHLD